uniref:Uncharacterized protein n=1 Tax=Glossina brevipalpis TaxID=37001 RepID=A0A1A9W8W5_9MUSC
MFSNLFIKHQFHISLVRQIPRKMNAGLGHLIDKIEDAADIIREDPEGHGDLESDFMQASKSYREHEFDLDKRREQIRRLMIKHKYFRGETLPNLLTYAEKEHIRLLHSRDAEEWSIERLAESFPATPEIITKILRSNWRPLSVKRVRSHDQRVFENWQLYKKGEFDKQLPLELKEHLKKFIDRRLEDLKALPNPAQTFTSIELPKPKIQEFQSIITSCTKYKNIVPTSNKTLLSNQRDKEKIQATLNEESIESVANPFKTDTITRDINVKFVDNNMVISAENSKYASPKEILLSDHNNSQQKLDKLNEEEETYLLSKVRDKRKMRLEELKTMKLNHLEDKEKSQNTMDREAIENLENPSATGIIRKDTSLDFTDKFASNEVIISAEDSKRFEMSTVKDRIHIPRKLWRRGATYRLEDFITIKYVI